MGGSTKYEDDLKELCYLCKLAPEEGLNLLEHCKFNLVEAGK